MLPQVPHGLREPETYGGRAWHLPQPRHGSLYSRVLHSWTRGAGLMPGHLQRRAPPQREAQVCTRGTHMNTHAHTSRDAHEHTHKSTGVLRTGVWGRQPPPAGTWPPASAPRPATAWLSSSPTAGPLCRSFHPTPAAPHGDSQNEWNFPAAGMETHAGAGQAAQAGGSGLTVRRTYSPGEQGALWLREHSLGWRVTGGWGVSRKARAGAEQ